MRLLLTIFCSAIIAVSCQGQPTPPGNGTTTQPVEPPTEVIRNLFVADSIPTSTLTDDDKRVLRLRYAGDRSIINVRVIPNPFPNTDSLFYFKKIRCNLSPSRTFIAERTQITLEPYGNKSYLLWTAKLVNTDVTSNRPDFNIMYIQALPDNKNPDKFYFGSVSIHVSDRQ